MNRVVLDSRPLSKVEYLLVESFVSVLSHCNRLGFHPYWHVCQAELLSPLDLVLILWIFAVHRGQVIQILEFLVFEKVISDLVSVPLFLF